MLAEKQLRKTLEQELQMDLSGHKALIRAEVSFPVVAYSLLCSVNILKPGSS